MKRLSNLLAALVFASLVIFMSCGSSDDSPGTTLKEERTALLAQQWSVDASSVTYDGGPEGDWTGFSVTFTEGGSYNTSGTPGGYEEIWPASGTWSFTDDNANEIMRNDGVEMTVNTLEENSLSLTFEVDDPNGRTSGLYDADWKFTFN